jgi:hypothetical protein
MPTHLKNASRHERGWKQPKEVIEALQRELAKKAVSLTVRCSIEELLGEFSKRFGIRIFFPKHLSRQDVTMPPSGQERL